MKTPFPTLLAPSKVGPREVKNRIIMTGMSAHMAPDAGWVTDREVAFYDRRARGGPGYIVVGAAFVHPSGTFGAQLGIHRDEMISGLSRLASVIKRQGAVASIQLHHAGRQTSAAVAGHELIAPSAIPCPVKQEMPRAMTLEDIEQVFNWYEEGARRAMEAGFDGIEVHGAHGYLPAQFLSSRSNRRADDYGGTLANRARFICEIVRRVRGTVGPDVPLSVKICGDEYADNGLTLEETPQIAAYLAEAGTDLITVSAGVAPYYYTVPGMALPPGCFVDAARAVKQAVQIPVSAVGRITTPAQAEDILSSGAADFISLGRALIADPDWPEKAATGKADSICICIGCNKGCHDPTRSERATACLLNAEAGFERELEISPAAMVRKVLVVGGGPAGLEAARVASLRGHEVVLCERTAYWGGRLHLGTFPPHKADYQHGIDYLAAQCETLGVDMRLGTEVSLSLVESIAPDTVIIATGAEPTWPDLPGLGRSSTTLRDRIPAYSADDVLAGEAITGEHVVLAGGGSVGAEVAHHLGDQGKRITVLQRGVHWGHGMPPDARWHLEQATNGLRVDFKVETEVTHVTDNVVHARQRQERLSFEDVDAVVVAAGAAPVNQLIEDLRALAIHVEIAGDVLAPRSALEAVAEGYRAAIRI